MPRQLTVKQDPGHRGIAGSETADAYAKDAAERRIPGKGSQLAAGRISSPFPKRRAAEWAIRCWKKDIAIRKQGERTRTKIQAEN